MIWYSTWAGTLPAHVKGDNMFTDEELQETFFPVPDIDSIPMLDRFEDYELAKAFANLDPFFDERCQ